MKEKYVILTETRRPAETSRGPAAGPAGAGAAATGLSVAIDELAPTASRAVARSQGVLAVAPVIPMKLIAPLDVPGPVTAATTAWGITAVGADTSPFDGAGIVVAVLDTGIDATHPAFAGVQLVQQDFTGEGDGDQNGHGTHCAGTIFGRDVQGTRIGVARGVTRALIGKVLGQQGGGGSDQIVQAIQWAITNGAHVISMSLGIDFPGFVRFLVDDRGLPIELATTVALEGYRQNVLLFERLASLVEAQSAFRQAAIVVAAAGNESQRSVDPDFEIACSPPAVSDGIVSVAALGQVGAQLTIADFSNVNATVSGPGVAIVSARAGGGLRTLSGTSMATPHVAGVAALWAQKLSTPGPLIANQLFARLVASGTSQGLLAGFDPTDVGAGLVQAPQA